MSDLITCLVAFLRDFQTLNKKQLANQAEELEGWAIFVRCHPESMLLEFKIYFVCWALSRYARRQFRKLIEIEMRKKFVAHI